MEFRAVASNADAVPAVAPLRRKRGGQPGNSNAVKTGYRMAAAKAERRSIAAIVRMGERLSLLARVIEALHARDNPEKRQTKRPGPRPVLEKLLLDLAKRVNSRNRQTNDPPVPTGELEKATNEYCLQLVDTTLRAHHEYLTEGSLHAHRAMALFFKPNPLLEGLAHNFVIPAAAKRRAGTQGQQTPVLEAPGSRVSDAFGGLARDDRTYGAIR